MSLLIYQLISKYKRKTYLEIGQRAGLGTQRLSILIGLSPLNSFVGCKLIKGQTKMKRQKHGYMWSIIFAKGTRVWKSLFQYHTGVHLALTCGLIQLEPSSCSSLWKLPDQLEPSSSRSEQHRSDPSKLPQHKISEERMWGEVVVRLQMLFNSVL